ncbi:Uncharacterised protein [Neisseria animalis]|nr:Uncharacterised protein [Neisseria animalis]
MRQAVIKNQEYGVVLFFIIEKPVVQQGRRGRYPKDVGLPGAQIQVF